MENLKEISAKQINDLFNILQARFTQNINRHSEIEWANVRAKLEANTDKLWSLTEMENTGGEPDIIGYDKQTNQYLFFDCALESPSGRRSLCYDKEALESRKEHKPKSNVIDMASFMGVELLNEEQYRTLQQFGKFDSKTSSWIKTPESIRNLGGAIFADFRYDNIFVYHNGAESYYAGRGFRSLLKV